MRARAAAAGVWCLAMAWCFVAGRQVPLLALVDLGFHELGHFVTYVLPWDIVTAAMGSVTQVAVPIGLAAYFLVQRHERLSAAVCLAWAATSAWGVHVYVADAPFERLELIGGDHDWAFILNEFDRMSWAAALARLVWLFGLACLAGAFALVAVTAIASVPERDESPPPVVGTGFRTRWLDE